MSQPSFCGLVLAAGMGTRMKSALPKCLHRVCGVSMADHALLALQGAGASQCGIIVGHGGEQVHTSLTQPAELIWQKEQLGTGHAVLQAKGFLEAHPGLVVIVPGDAPLIQHESISKLVSRHLASNAAVSIATIVLDDPTAYGRIVRDSAGKFLKIVEENDADEQTRAIQEVGVSVYCFEVNALLNTLPKISPNEGKKEFYLVDAVTILAAEGKKVHVEIFPDSDEFMGVNNRWELALAQERMQARILKSLAQSGVTLVNWKSISVDANCTVEADVTLLEGAKLCGNTHIKRGSRIGPWTLVDSSTVGEDCKVVLSHLVRCSVGDRTSVGPFANLRPNAEIGCDCKIGNFVEVKNSQLEPHVSASHLSYIGDAEVGEYTNIGAGTIFCNYNGFDKNRVKVGKDVFLGSNSTLVAPITIEEGAMIAAGSVVTKDIPAHSAAFGRSRTEIKVGWAADWRQRMREQKEQSRREIAEKVMGSLPSGEKWD